MITKKDFIKIMTKWIEFEEKEHIADKALKGVNPDFSGFPFSPYAELTIEILEKDMGCYRENQEGLISWWLWDLDREGLINKSAEIEHSSEHKTAPNKKFNLTTLDKLYDYIIKYGQDKE
ncbi:MAG: hypothetical protein WC196_07555 [Bacilli bacterium]